MSDVQHGTLTFGSDGSFVYIPDANYFGSDTFVYQLVTYPAPLNLWNDEATVTITVNPFADTPVLGEIPNATIRRTGSVHFHCHTATDGDPAPDADLQFGRCSSYRRSDQRFYWRLHLDNPANCRVVALTPSLSRSATTLLQHPFATNSQLP